MPVRDVLIVGAGPSGLATAIAAKHQGLDYVIVEKGVLVNSIFNFPMHMVFFTTPELLEIGGLPLVTPYDKPTRLEALRYYRRVVDTFDLQISFHEEVVAIERDGTTAIVRGDDRDASRRARACDRRAPSCWPSATTTCPNYLGVPGEDLPHVSHYYTDAHPYYRQRVVVVGGKNSAAEAALELFRGGAHVTLVHRHADARRLDQVLGAARHREPHQGRLDRRRASSRASSRSRRRRSSIEHDGHAAKRSRPKACSC